MKPIKGISQDNHPIDMMEGFYFYGKNGVQASTLGAVRNEEGFIKLHELPYDYNGKIVIDQMTVVFSTDNINSEIGLFDTIDEVYTVLYNDSAPSSVKLDFNTANPITGVGKRDYNGNIIIVWRDGLNVPRIWNTSKPFTTENDIRLYPNVTVPKLVTEEEAYGGSLPIGAIYPFIQFEDVEGNKSMWIGEHPPIYLKGPDNFGGGQGVSSGKAIKITLTNTDQSFDYINIALVIRSEGTVTSAVYRTRINNSTEVAFAITGTETTTPISLAELVTPRSVYKDIVAFTNSNGTLYGANVKEEERPNLQPYINNIEVRWRSTAKDVAASSKASYKTLQHEEVYALYLGVVFKNLQGEMIYHIPGRAKRTDLTLQLTSAVTATGVDESALISTVAAANGLNEAAQANEASFHLWDDLKVNPDAKIFQTRDTCRLGGSFIENGEDVYYGTPGFWQNEDETYPDDAETWGALAGQKVRHHKLPSQRFMAENVYTLQAYGIQSMDTMQLEVLASSINFPPEIEETIQGYRIYIAKRSPNNSLVVGQDLTIFNGRQANPETGVSTFTEDFHTVGNFDHILASGFSGASNVWLDGSLGEARPLSLRCHALDILLNKPGVFPNYASVQYKLRYHHNENEHTSFEDIDPAGTNPVSEFNKYKYTLLQSAVAKNFVLNVASDFTNQVRTVRVATSLNDLMKRHRLLAINNSSTKYVPQGIVNDLLYNDRGEENLYLRPFKSDLFASGVLSKSNCQFFGNDIYGATYPDAQYFRYPMFEEVLLVNLIAYKTNCYVSFLEQAAMVNSKTYQLNENGVTTGDAYVSLQSFTTIGWHRVFLQNPAETGLRAHHTYAGVSVADPLARYQDGNKGSWFYPKSNYDYPEQISINDLVKYNYNRAFSGGNDLTAKAVFNSFIGYLTNFPYRVIKFGDSKTEEREDAWRVQTALDYYESVKNRGQITGITAVDDVVIIHYEHAFRITRRAGEIKDESGASFFLGTGNIFQVDPSEVGTSTAGFAGKLQIRNGVLTPIGYIFIDSAFNAIYSFDQTSGLKTLHQGLSSVLRDYFKEYVISDSPFANFGVLIEYDARYGRLMFTIKGRTLPEKVEKSLTFSYCPDTESIVFFHDYIPNDYIPGRSLLYLVGNKKEIYRASGGPYGKYLTDTIHPFYIDVAFSAGKNSAILNNVEWLSTILDANDKELRDKTFTSITVWNSHQNSSKIVLTPHSPLNISGSSNSRNNKGYWSMDDLRNLAVKGSNAIDNIFNDFRILTDELDLNKPWFEKELLEDNWFIVRFEYNNLDNNKFLLHDVDINASQSTL